MRKFLIDRALAGAILQALYSMCSQGGELDQRQRGGGGGGQLWCSQGECTGSAEPEVLSGSDRLRFGSLCRRPTNRKTIRLEDFERGGVNNFALPIIRAVLALVDTTQTLGVVGDKDRCMADVYIYFCRNEFYGCVVCYEGDFSHNDIDRSPDSILTPNLGMHP